jgi:hypothetical protein
MTNKYVPAPDLVAAAREFIRSEGDGCIVSIDQLLDELSGKFGDRFPVSPDTYEVLDLIETLWADPHVDQVSHSGLIEFAWSEKGFDGPSHGIRRDAARSSDRAGEEEDRSVPTVDVAEGHVPQGDDQGVGDGEQ